MGKTTKATKGGSLASDAVMSVMKGKNCDFQPNAVQLDMKHAGFNDNNLPFNLNTMPLDNQGFIQIAAGRKPTKKGKKGKKGKKPTKSGKVLKGGMYPEYAAYSEVDPQHYNIFDLNTPYYMDSAHNLRSNDGASSIFGATVPENSLKKISDVLNGETPVLAGDSPLPSDLRFGNMSLDYKAPTLEGRDSLVDIPPILDGGEIQKASVYPESPVSELTLDNFRLPNNMIGGTRRKKSKSPKKPKKTKKSKNAYILFCEEQRKVLKKKGLSQKEIMKKCGELWRAQKK